MAAFQVIEHIKNNLVELFFLFTLKLDTKQILLIFLGYKRFMKAEVKDLFSL